MIVDTHVHSWEVPPRAGPAVGEVCLLPNLQLHGAHDDGDGLLRCRYEDLPTATPTPRVSVCGLPGRSQLDKTRDRDRLGWPQDKHHLASPGGEHRPAANEFIRDFRSVSALDR